MRALNIFSLLICFSLTSCGPDEKPRAKLAEEKRLDCLDKICPGDIEPAKHDTLRDVSLKLNGEWFYGPRAYFGTGARAVFYWPSKTPGSGGSDGQPFPEKGKEFYDVAIEIFLRSNNFLPEPRNYRLIRWADERGWIESRSTLRTGLDVIRMKHVAGPNGYFLDHVGYYVATQLKDQDGFPPVAMCSETASVGGGGAGFVWRPGIWAGIRMHQKHCADWPEIFQEVSRVLQLIQKV